MTSGNSCVQLCIHNGLTALAAQRQLNNLMTNSCSRRTAYVSTTVTLYRCQVSAVVLGVGTRLTAVVLRVGTRFSTRHQH